MACEALGVQQHQVRVRVRTTFCSPMAAPNAAYNIRSMSLSPSLPLLSVNTMGGAVSTRGTRSTSTGARTAALRGEARCRARRRPSRTNGEAQTSSVAAQ